jgi:pimeloyl-ACP methyl ester carboxylesterase
MNLIAVIVSGFVRFIAHLKSFSIFHRTLCLLFLTIALSSCSDSSDNARRATDESESPRGVWEEHTCWMAIPEGLMETDFTCGTFTVPADWDYPDGDSLAFEVAVLRARTSPSQADPFVFLGGGPGAWNLEGYLYREAATVLSPISETRDIVFFDKRGNGLSTPNLFCPEYYEQTLQAYGVVQEVAEDVDQWLVGYQECHTRLTGEGINLSNFTSYQVASDLKALMGALGYEKYNLYGISYGTREAQVMMRDHPENIRSVILDSTVVPGMGNPANWAPNFERSYNLMLEACSASSECSSSYPDLEETMVTAVNQLNEVPHYSPVSQTDGTTVDVYITGDRFVTAIQQVMYQAGLIPLLPTVIYATAAGDMGLVDSFVPQVLKTSGDDWGLHAATICAEEVPFSNVETAMTAK